MLGVCAQRNDKIADEVHHLRAEESVSDLHATCTRYYADCKAGFSTIVMFEVLLQLLPLHLMGTERH